MEPSPASRWIERWCTLVPASGCVLDVACGSGRHVRFFIERGHRVTAIDRNREALSTMADLPAVDLVEADIESGPWPLPGRRFDAVVVTNYLWRPLLPQIVHSVDEGGVLLYETFATGQETVGRPSRAEFLLRPGELLDTVAGHLRVIAYEDGFLTSPERFVQRIAAVRMPASLPADPRRIVLAEPDALAQAADR